MADQIKVAAAAAGHDHGGACANCGAALSGPFCAQCGQRAHLHRTIGEVFHEFLHGITHFDGKAWKTLPMLVFRPGTLTRSYIEGQRARHIAPVPLFLLVVFTMFFVLSFASLGDVISDNRPVDDKAGMTRALADIDRQIADARARGDSARVTELETGRRLVTAVGVQGGEGSIIDRAAAEIATADRDGALSINTGFAWLDAKARSALANPRLVLYKLQTKAYKLSFLLVPLSLPWLWLVFLWKRGVGLYDHAIFTLYSISFMSLLFIAASLLLSAGITSELVWVPLLLAPGAHLFVQLRDTYGLGWFSAGWRTLYLTLAAMLTMSLYLVILFVLGVLD